MVRLDSKIRPSATSKLLSPLGPYTVIHDYNTGETATESDRYLENEHRRNFYFSLNPCRLHTPHQTPAFLSLPLYVAPRHQ